MAAENLDRLWDDWGKTLSESHEKTILLLRRGKPLEASAEFQGRFLVAVKEVYSEAAIVAPERFSKSENWSAWLRHLYALTVSAKAKLRAPSAADSLAALTKIRDHFHRLRVETGTQQSNDRIHAFFLEAQKEKPDATLLNREFAALALAHPSRKAKAKAKQFEKMKTAWNESVVPLLADGAVAPSEIEPLRAATQGFHEAFGAQIE